MLSVLSRSFSITSSAKFINKVMLIGFVGKDPEYYQFPNPGKNEGSHSFSLALPHKPDDTATWMRVRVLGNEKTLGEQVRKGTKVFVEGRIQGWKNEDKQGIYIDAIRVLSIGRPRDTVSEETDTYAINEMELEAASNETPVDKNF